MLAFLDVGGPEMLLVFVLVLVLFGGKRMPELARSLGKSLRDFKKAREGVEDQIKRALEDDPAPVKRIKKTRKAALPTTTPDDTSVYDEAANAAGGTTAAAIGSGDDPTDDSDPSITSDASDESKSSDSNHSGSESDYQDVDPYADEYIGGTASSDAGAHGVKNESTGEGESAPEAADDSATEKKKSAPDASSGAADGGGI